MLSFKELKIGQIYKWLIEDDQNVFAYCKVNKQPIKLSQSFYFYLVSVDCIGVYSLLTNNGYLTGSFFKQRQI